MVDVGAYYYLWYDEEQWRKWGCVHTPLRDFYDSSNPEMISQHVEWAKQYGIKFFVVGWDGPEKEGNKIDRNLRNCFLKNLPPHGVQFAILYESRARFQVPEGPIKIDDPARRRRLVDDFSYMAANYFNDERYYKIDGRPFVVLYVTRDFTGDVKGVIQALRTNQLYLVGDEVYWSGITRSRLKIWPSKLKDPERIKLYDGVTPYNMHTSNREILDNFENQLEGIYGDWSKALSSFDVDFIPSAIPGYDDTKVPNRKNIPLQRGLDRFDRQFQIGIKHLSKRNVLLITSFNEWHEDTQIEPAENYKPPAEPFSYLEAVEHRRTLR